MKHALLLGLIIALGVSVLLVSGSILRTTGDGTSDEPGAALPPAEAAPPTPAAEGPPMQGKAPAHQRRLSAPLLSDQEPAAAPVEASGRPTREPRETPRSLAEMAEQRELMRGLMRGEPAERLALAHGILAEQSTGTMAHRALEVLVELDPLAAVAKLHELAAESTDDPRRLKVNSSMIERLGRQDGVLTDEDLSTFFASGEPGVRAAAASALEARGDDSLVREFIAERTDELTGELAGEDERSRTQALRELSTLRSPATKQLFISLLADDSEQVRLQAVRSLGRHGADASVLDELRPLLEDPSDRVRRAAARVVEMSERRRGSGMRRSDF